MNAHRLARNTLYNLIGQGVPLFLALLAFPLLIQQLGTDRFGALTLLWAVIGYFSLFDLGISRALIKVVAEKSAAGETDQVPAFIDTALILTGSLGVAAALLLAAVTPWLVTSTLSMPPELAQETRSALYILAASLPLVTTSATFKGVLEGQQRFGTSNAIQVGMGAVTFIGPLAVLAVSVSLTAIATALAAGRIVAWIAYFISSARLFPAASRGLALQGRAAAALLRIGGWMAVSSVIGPIMVYMDRFVIGSVISLTAVAYYVTPYEVVTKLWLIPGALAAVLYPAFSASFNRDRERTARLFGQGTKYAFIALFPITLVLVTFSHEALALWIGAEFARNSYRVFQILAVGVLINSLAQIAYALVQGAGRPDLTAKFHLAELPFYLAALGWLVPAYGVTGAALAWTGRVIVDAALLFYASANLISVETLPRVNQAWLLPFLAGIVIAMGAALENALAKLGFLGVGLPVLLAWCWLRCFSADERAVVLGLFLHSNTKP
ncbi:flippase [Pelomicrobium sp. G1]|uniref:flippase n=1 Tax=unclassified Pelomicrobium TaxID=2815318 RepID=UPI0021DC5935|nr:MAG: polysaccharide biosynthesis protein [Burkholderiales bacterium]